MAKIILSINAGSSSVKVSVYKASSKSEDPTELAVVQVDGLTAPPPTLKYSRGDEHVKGKQLEGISSQEDAFKYILEHLEKDKGLPELSHRDEIQYACHRVVHGGDYPKAQVIDANTFHHIEELSDLAPLHNAPALTIVTAVYHALPKATNIAYFDSSFHTTLPPHIRTYPIDPTVASRNKLRKYGFHGISYAFVARAVSSYLAKPAHALNIIALHLGSGASACAIRHGRSLDTSMGLTPLDGLPGATRSGSIDPSLVFHYTHDAGRPAPGSAQKMHVTEAEHILNKQSGWRALAGTTDFGAISSASEDAGAQLAFDVFVDRILGFVGSYYVKLRGEVDALVFAGGIGEKGARLRRAVAEGAGCLGFGIDARRNEVEAPEGVVWDVGREGARHRVLVCKTDEQLEMARGCVQEAETFGSKEQGA